jgi:hypothetical protein
LELPPFNEDGLPPPGDYEMSLEELKGSMLVEGPEEGYPDWDSGWRMKLVENLEVMVGQLRRVRITEIYVDGSFVEDKDYPNDIDGYFECDVVELAAGNLQRELNGLDPHKSGHGTRRAADRTGTRRRGSCRCGTVTGWSSTRTTRDY